MEGPGNVVLAGGLLQIAFAFLIFAAAGRLRLRASLALLFLLNGIATLANLMRVSSGDSWHVLAVAADRITGAFLIEAGVLLSAGRLARFENASGRIAIAALVAIPLLAALLGATSQLLLFLGDALALAGFLVALVGTFLGAAERGFTAHHQALLLAFAPRAFEWTILLGSILLSQLSQFDPFHRETLLMPGRMLFLGAMVAFTGYAVARAPRARILITTAGVLGFISAVGLTFLGAPVFALFTLIVNRPLFLVAALAFARPDDALRLPLHPFASPAAGVAVGATAGIFLAHAIEPGSILLAIFVASAMGLIGYTVTSLLRTRDSADPRGLPERDTAEARSSLASTLDRAKRDALAAALSRTETTQADRLLLSLRGVRFEASRAAPAAAGTAGISAATGIPRKHVPVIARRINERGSIAPTPAARSPRATSRVPLVEVEAGAVEGVRKPRVPRYRLTASGEAAAEDVARRLGVETWTPEELRAALVDIHAGGEETPLVVGVRGPPRRE